jgi:hypothetical protein
MKCNLNYAEQTTGHANPAQCADMKYLEEMKNKTRLSEISGSYGGEYMMAVFWVVAPMEAVITSETSVNFYQITRHNNPEDSHLHTRPHENLKSHKFKFLTLNLQEIGMLSGSRAFRHKYFICTRILC